MATDWIMVRINRATHARLEAARQSMLLAVEVGLRDVELDNRDRFSLDQVIRVLLDARDRHAERRRRSAAARRRRGRRRRADELVTDQAGELVHLDQAGDVAGELDEKHHKPDNQRISDTSRVFNSLSQREASQR